MQYPYFYLEFKGLIFFQPQNDGNLTQGEMYESGNGTRIQSECYPEITAKILFLNGADKTRNFYFLKLPHNGFIDTLRQLNQRTSDV